jgi:hypothetical protein
MRPTDTGIGIGQAFEEDVLPPDHASALHADFQELTDESFDDVTLLELPGWVEETSMSQYMPRCYRAWIQSLDRQAFRVATATVA